MLIAGARQLIASAVEVELQELLGRYEGQTAPGGCAAVVRNGYQPERELQTGIGPVTVRIPKVRSRSGEPVTFHSALVPPYVRKTRSLEAAFVPEGRVQWFPDTYEAKYPKATACLQKDREELLAFYCFPAKHWQSLRTSNPIESAFGTIRHRTKRSKGCLSRDGMLHIMFNLGMCAEQNWRKLRGFDSLAKVIEGVQFRDGIEVKESETKNPVAA